MATFPKIIANALAELSPRQRDVVVARFGLEGKQEGETLAAIGDRLHITRERVRQIENAAMATVAKSIEKHGETVAALAKVKSYIAAKGGVALKADVAAYAATLAKSVSEAQLDFLAEASGALSSHREDEDFLPLYAVGAKERKAAQSFIEGWKGTLRSRRAQVFQDSIMRNSRVS